MSLEGFDAESPPSPDAGFFGQSLSPEEAAVVIVPVPFEATTSYGQGTAAGPEAMRQASHQMDFFDFRLGRTYERGFSTLGSDWSAPIEKLNKDCFALIQKIRAGAADSKSLLERVNAMGAELTEKVRSKVGGLMDAGKFVATVGGDHSIALGAILAASERHEELGVLHFDAHADLRDSYEGFKYSHASVMHRVLEDSAIARLVSVGIRDYSESEYESAERPDDRVCTLYDEDLRDSVLRGQSFASVTRLVLDHLPDLVYVSFDIDGLDPALCPSTGTPVPGGLSFNEAIFLIKAVRRSGRKIVGLDLCEVSPSGREGDEWDANVGARLLYKMIALAITEDIRGLAS